MNAPRINPEGILMVVGLYALFILAVFLACGKPSHPKRYDSGGFCWISQEGEDELIPCNTPEEP